MTFVRNIYLSIRAMLAPSPASLLTSLSRTADRLDVVFKRLGDEACALADETGRSYDRQRAAAAREAAFRNAIADRQDRVTADMGQAMRVRDRIRALID